MLSFSVKQNINEKLTHVVCEQSLLRLVSEPVCTGFHRKGALKLVIVWVTSGCLVAGDIGPSTCSLGHWSR